MTKPKKKLKPWPLLKTYPVLPGYTINEVIAQRKGLSQLPIQFPK